MKKYMESWRYENYNNMMSWASENIPEQEVNMYDAVGQGEIMAAYFAVQAMALDMQMQ